MLEQKQEYKETKTLINLKQREYLRSLLVWEYIYLYCNFYIYNFK